MAPSRERLLKLAAIPVTVDDPRPPHGVPPTAYGGNVPRTSYQASNWRTNLAAWLDRTGNQVRGWFNDGAQVPAPPAQRPQSAPSVGSTPPPAHTGPSAGAGGETTVPLPPGALERAEAIHARAAANAAWRQAARARAAESFGGDVKAMQRAIGTRDDGIIGRDTRRKYQAYLHSGKGWGQAATAAPAAPAQAPAQAPAPVAAPAPVPSPSPQAPPAQAQLVQGAVGKPQAISAAEMAKSPYDAGPREHPYWMVEKARAQQAAAKKEPQATAAAPSSP